MRRFAGLLALVLAAGLRGQETPFPKTEQAGEALKRLDEMPAAVEYRRQTQVLDDLEKKHRERVMRLYEKREKLAQSPGYKEYLKRRADLESKRESAWEGERKAMAGAAQQLYAARHAEIRGLAPAQVPEGRSLKFDVLNYPRVDGSTSTGPLSIILACRILGAPYEWIYPEPAGHPWPARRDLSPFFLPAAASRAPRDLELQLATLNVVAKPEWKGGERLAVMINSLLAASSSTHDAYVNLIEGRSDLNLTARPPSESERKLAAEKKVEVRLEPVARDAFVFIVNQKNPVKGLTRGQVRQIYEEKITDWGAVGGAAGKIRALRRERDSGSRELFDALVMGGQPLAEGERYASLYGYGMGGPYSQLTQDASGLGYSVYYYEHFMAASPYTRLLPIDGVEPSAKTIASGAYPWVTRVYVAYRASERENSPAMKLLRWLLSPEGQAVVRESGYVPEKGP
jgi:ABC-type phosphate transport system substrate-binding protein